MARTETETPNGLLELTRECERTARQLMHRLHMVDSRSLAAAMASDAAKITADAYALARRAIVAWGRDPYAYDVRHTAPYSIDEYAETAKHEVTINERNENFLTPEALQRMRSRHKSQLKTLQLELANERKKEIARRS